MYHQRPFGAPDPPWWGDNRMPYSLSYSSYQVDKAYDADAITEWEYYFYYDMFSLDDYTPRQTEKIDEVEIKLKRFYN